MLLQLILRTAAIPLEFHTCLCSGPYVNALPTVISLWALNFCILPGQRRAGTVLCLATFLLYSNLHFSLCIHIWPMLLKQAFVSLIKHPNIPGKCKTHVFSESGVGPRPYHFSLSHTWFWYVAKRCLFPHKFQKPSFCLYTVSTPYAYVPYIFN